MMRHCRARFLGWPVPALLAAALVSGPLSCGGTDGDGDRNEGAPVPPSGSAPEAAIADAGDADAGRDGGPPGSWDEPLPDAGPWTGGTEWVLLLGFDDWTRLPGRTDAIILAAFRHETGDIGLISIPRDLWVDIPGWEPGRINKVYRVGEMLHGTGGGHRLVKTVLRNELGIRIDRTVAVDFRGFRQIVDLLGGITVDVRCPIRDNFIDASSSTGWDRLELDAGRQRMDGRTALLYSRSRHGRSDLDRSRRQQAVLMGLKRRIVSWNAIPRLPWLWRVTAAHARTDLALADAVRLATTAASADAGMVHGLVPRPPVVRSWRSPEGQSVLLLDRRLFARALESLFDAPAPGLRGGTPCPDPDAAVNWRDRQRAYRLRHGGGPQADGGTDPASEDEPEDEDPLAPGDAGP